jgi:hypothetical protein
MSPLIGRMVCIEFQASVFSITIASDHSSTFMVSALTFPLPECSCHRVLSEQRPRMSTPLSTSGDFFVWGGIEVGGGDVPCVEEVGKVAEIAEGDVDYAVGAADAMFTRLGGSVSLWGAGLKG